MWSVYIKNELYFLLATGQIHYGCQVCGCSPVQWRWPWTGRNLCQGHWRSRSTPSVWPCEKWKWSWWTQPRIWISSEETCSEQSEHQQPRDNFQSWRTWHFGLKSPSQVPERYPEMVWGLGASVPETEPEALPSCHWTLLHPGFATVTALKTEIRLSEAEPRKDGVVELCEFTVILWWPGHSCEVFWRAWQARWIIQVPDTTFLVLCCDVLSHSEFDSRLGFHFPQCNIPVVPVVVPVDECSVPPRHFQQAPYPSADAWQMSRLAPWEYTPNAMVELLPHRHCVGANLTAP